LNDVDGGGGSHTSCIGDGGCGSRKRRALSSVDFAKEVAVIMESKIEEEEETETDVGEEEEEDVSFCLDRDGEEAKAPPSSVSRVGAKIRRLNLTDDDEGDGGGGGDGGNDPDTNAKQRRRPIDAAVRLQDPEGYDPVDDVSPRDVVNFPSFANFDSPSHEAKRGAGRGGGVGMDNGGEEFNHDHIPPARSPPTSAFELPQIPRSTARKAKAHHRRRILDDSNDDDDRMSSSPPPPRGLRMLGRANSFMQMFGISGGLVSDIIVEGEEGIGGGGGGSGGGSHGSSKRRNDLYDDFIRKPDSSVEDDVGLAMPSPKRPIRHNNHRRYTPASPPDDDGGAPTSSFSRFVSDFEVVGTLGNGSFGSVYSVRNRTDRRLYAIKAAKREARGTSDRDRMLQEVYALSALSDKACVSSMHIVRYHQAWMEGNRLYIQTELCDGTLLGQMRGAGIDERGRYKLLREMLLALDLVHKTGMIHLDIKPENIFIKNGHYKLGDFGLVSKIENHNDVEEGDSRYMSMELLLGELDDLTKVRNETFHRLSFCSNKNSRFSCVAPSTKSDIFSLGATMYEICLGRPENLPENGQEWQDIRHGKLLPMPNTAIELQMIVWEMMAPEWITRPSADKLLKRRQLLSDEQQQLIVERNKVNVANMALDAQKVSVITREGGGG
jgi:wee1-like protein kinase